MKIIPEVKPERIKPCKCCQDKCKNDSALKLTQEDDPSQRIFMKGKHSLSVTMKAWGGAENQN